MSLACCYQRCLLLLLKCGLCAIVCVPGSVPGCVQAMLNLIYAAGVLVALVLLVPECITLRTHLRLKHASSVRLMMVIMVPIASILLMQMLLHHHYIVTIACSLRMCDCALPHRCTLAQRSSMLLANPDIARQVGRTIILAQNTSHIRAKAKSGAAPKFGLSKSMCLPCSVICSMPAAYTFPAVPCMAIGPPLCWC